jgi:putative tricarboxylic transport membrane protein
MEENKPVASIRAADVATALAFLAFGLLVVWDSRRLGSQWGSDGPQAGYFPFYIGIILCVSSIVNLLRAIGMGEKGKSPFVKWGQLRMILVVMIPTVIYVALISNPWLNLGIYTASTIYIAMFMYFLGKYGWRKIIPVSVGTMVFFFVMFEIWFKVPLPKGPLEAAFGFS